MSASESDFISHGTIIATRYTEACAICLESDSETFLTTKTCSHIFHSTCLQSWLADHTSCPMCRTKLFRATVWKVRCHYEIPSANGDGAYEYLILDEFLELCSVESKMAMIRKRVHAGKVVHLRVELEI
jgi:hypothetical protein